LTEALNKRGQQFKQESGGLKPPGTQTTTRPPGDGGSTTRPPEKDGLWNKFRQNWSKLGNNDKKTVRNVFPKVNEDSFKDLSLNKRHGLVNAVDEGNITPQERRELYKLFNYEEKEPPDVSPTKSKSQKPDTDDGKNDLWDKFLSIWKDPRFKDNASDRNLIKNLFFGGKNPGTMSYQEGLSYWKNINLEKRKQLLNFLKDFDLSVEEKDTLKDKRPDDDDSGDGDVGGGVDDDDQEEDDIEIEGPEDTDPITGIQPKKKIVLDEKLADVTTIFIPEDADPISMPNVDKKIEKEVERLTLNLTSFTKEFIEGGIDFSSIDFVPLQEIFDENDILYFIGKDPNVPDDYNANILGIRELLMEILKLIEIELDKGRKGTNYAEFLQLFQLKYRDAGGPYYRFNLELDNDIMGELSVSVIKDLPPDDLDSEYIETRMAFDEEETVLED